MLCPRACLVVAALSACAPASVTPPLLGDYDGSSGPPPVGGGPGPGQDGATGDAGTTTLATASNPEGIVLAAGFLYFTNYGTGAGDGTIASVAVTGGTTTTLASGLDGPWALTVASGEVFFTLVPLSGVGSVAEVAVTAGNVTTLETTVDAYGIVNDGVNVYVPNDSAGVVIDAVPVTSGAAKHLLELGGDLQTRGLTLSGTDLFVATTGSQAALLQGSTSGAGNLGPLDVQTTQTFNDVLATPTTVYVTVDDPVNGQVLAFPRGSGTPVTLASGLVHPERLAVDGQNLYVTDPTGGNVWWINLTTSSAPVAFLSGLSSPLPIAVADALYVGVSDAILRVPKM